MKHILWFIYCTVNSYEKTFIGNDHMLVFRTMCLLFLLKQYYEIEK
jgi:hypothetical protein